MNVREMQTALNALGFPCGTPDGIAGPLTRTAVARFQLAYAHERITVDGLHGPQTFAALRTVLTSGRLAPHFGVSEVRSKGDGTAWVHRDLLFALEALRAHVGRPLPLISAWRDVAHNRRVGGASRSQHTFGAAPELDAIRGRLAPSAVRVAGRAADFNRGYIRLDEAVGLGLFGGFGHRDGWVTHVDMRAGSTSRPVTWRYG